jgi:hypothetical protein
MHIDEHGFAEPYEVVAKGNKISEKKAISIARKAKAVIDKDNQRPFLEKEIRDLADGWKHIYPAISTQLPSENHALVAVRTHRNGDQSAVVLIGQHRNIHINSVSAAIEWIHQHDNQEATQYFVVDLTT